MSRENVETVRRIYGHLDRGDPEAWDMLAPDVVLDASRRLLDPQVVRGREQVRDYMGQTFDFFEDPGVGGFFWEIEELVDAGEHVVAFNRTGGRGKASGVPVEARIAIVWTFRDGTPVAVAYFGDDRAGALAAAGLRA
jgi:ketosteroid isomerase-like protein